MFNVTTILTSSSFILGWFCFNASINVIEKTQEVSLAVIGLAFLGILIPVYGLTNIFKIKHSDSASSVLLFIAFLLYLLSLVLTPAIGMISGVILMISIFHLFWSDKRRRDFDK